MAENTPKEAEISIKIMVQKDKNKVIFAEADYNFLDILISFMTLPLGTLVRILEGCPDKKDVVLGGLKNLYRSLEDLPEKYLSTDESKYILLNPRSSTYDRCRRLKINIDDTESLKYFICQSSTCTRTTKSYSVCKFAKCGKCGNNMDLEIKFDSPLIANILAVQDNGGVFVSEVTTFIVTDDLSLMPNTSETWVQLLSDHGITAASQIEERTLNLGREQILVILKSALFSSFSLTYLVFPRTQFQWDLVGTLVQPVSNKEEVTNTKRLNLKVTLQKSTSKFLFAEAEEDFVDFVFGFMGIPLGVVVGKLMKGLSSLVSFDNLFKSICAGKCFKSQDVKDMLLEPKFLPKYLSLNQIFPLNVSEDSALFNSRYGSLVLRDPRVKGSFIKAAAKFMLTDDLCVTPLSPFSSIALLNKLQVPLYDVENHEVSIGIEEGLEILRASLNSSGKFLSALTNSLLEGNDLGISKKKAKLSGHFDEQQKIEGAKS